MSAASILTLHPDAKGDGGVERGRRRLLPGLDTGSLERGVTIHSWREARLAFRAGLATGSA